MTACGSLLSLLAYAVFCPGAAAPVGVIHLSGNPAEIGAAWGRMNGAHIRADMEKNFVAPARERGLDAAALIARGERFVEICGEVAPHWLEEARAIAVAADVEPDLYLAYIGSVYRQLFLGDECTSYTVHRNYTRNNALLFHKTRDNVEKPQAACIVASAVPGVNTFITVSDAAVLACMMMVNDKGLVGSADTGGTLGAGRPKFRGMMNTFILRQIAERAATCEEALAIVREFVDKGYYAGGGRTGTHWLFLDRTGTILEVSNHADKVEAVYHDEKVYFSLREDSKAADTLRAAQPPIDFLTFHNVSRDPSMCLPSSISGMTVELDPEHPDLLTCAWFTLPAWGPAFPLFLGGTATPLPLVNGEVYALSAAADAPREVWEDWVGAAHAAKEEAAVRARALIQAGDTAGARRILDDFARSTASAQVERLRGGGE